MIDVKNDFERWFKKQFGRLPNPEKESKLTQAVMRAAETLRKAKEELAEEEKIAAQYTAALYAITKAGKEKL
jgi:hypothetical protein